MTTTKPNLFIIIGIIIFWLIVASGSSWWIWNHYRSVTQPDLNKIPASTVNLDIQSLTQAVKLLENPTSN